MPREREAYRDIYENLLEYFGGKRILSKTEVARYLGIASKTAEKRYGITCNGVAVEKLARMLAE